MLQDIAPHIYHNQMSWKEPEADDFVLCYRGRTLYCKVEDGSLVLPRVKDVEPSALQYAFSIDERADYLLSDAELKEDNGFSYFDTGKLRTLVPGPALMAAAAAILIKPLREILFIGTLSFFLFLLIVQQGEGHFAESLTIVA